MRVIERSCYDLHSFPTDSVPPTSVWLMSVVPFCFKHFMLGACSGPQYSLPVTTIPIPYHSSNNGVNLADINLMLMAWRVLYSVQMSDPVTLFPVDSLSPPPRLPYFRMCEVRSGYGTSETLSDRIPE